MVQCPECGEEINEESKEYDCPFCGYEDYSEGFYECFNCGALFDWAGDLWECETAAMRESAFHSEDTFTTATMTMTSTVRTASPTSIRAGSESTTDSVMTKQCFYCSYPNRDDAKRCVNCGMELKKYWDKSSSRPKLVEDYKK